jgi:hypothetical protein
MKPIQFIKYQDTVWYNVNDYIKFLLETKSILPFLPPVMKRYRKPKTPFDVVYERLGRLKPVYQLVYNEEVYAEWVIYESLPRTLKPFLVNESDWTNHDCVFRQVHLSINESKSVSVMADDSYVASYFKEVVVSGR